MSLEQALKENTEALLAHTAAVNKLLSGTANVAGSATDATTASNDADDSADTTDEAPKRERGKPSPGKSKRTAAEVAEDKAADDADAAAAAGDADTGAVTFDELKVKLLKYLGEFARAEDRENPEGAHPEVIARRDAIKAALTKLGAEKLPDIAADAEKVGKLNTWLEEKALTADRGHGIGRLAADPEPADPEPAGDDDEDSDLDI